MKRKILGIGQAWPADQELPKDIKYHNKTWDQRIER